MNPAQLKARLCLPVVGAPMFIVSGCELVIAQCRSGIVGSFPALNARPQDALDGWLTRIKTALSDYLAANPAAKVAPYAVNLIIHKSNDRLEADLADCVRHEVPIIITSLRAPDPAMIEAIHGYGGLVFHDVINIRHAQKASAAGVDGLILVCAGAGGHAGTLSPFALVGEVRRIFDGIILLSGAIANGRSVLAAQALGADLAYMGTRFIASEEAHADADYKQMLIDHAAGDIVYSSLFSGVHGNYLRPSIIAAGLDPDNLPDGDRDTMKFGSGGSSRPKAWRDIKGAGQGLGVITDAPPVADIVARLREEYMAAAQQLQRVIF